MSSQDLFIDSDAETQPPSPSIVVVSDYEGGPETSQYSLTFASIRARYPDLYGTQVFKINHPTLFIHFILFIFVFNILRKLKTFWMSAPHYAFCNTSTECLNVIM